MKPLAPYSLSVVAFFPWSEQFPEGMNVRPLNPNYGMVITEGMLMLRITRSRLKLFGGPNGTLGIAANAIDDTQPLLVDLTGEPLWVTTKDTPFVALRRSNGSILIGGKNGISEIQPNGDEVKLSDEFTNFLAEGPEGGYWTIQSQDHWAIYFDAKGRQQARFGFYDSRDAVPDSAGRLCYPMWDPPAWHCLDHHGKRAELPGFTVTSFSTVIGIGNGRLIADESRGIKVEHQGHEPRFFPLMTAGLTHENLPFVSFLVEGEIGLKIGDQEVQWLALPPKYLEGHSALGVVGVDRDHYWVESKRWGILLDHRGHVVEDFRLTEESYEHRLYPKTWTVESMSAFGGGPILLSCSGPTGVAILKLGLD